MKGLVVKGIAGFYYVRNEEGQVTQCKARGKFKKKGQTLFVGDEVDYEVLEDGDGIINEIYPRKNQFIRPPISNVDTFVVVVAGCQPDPNPRIIDRFLVMAEKSGAKVILCVNKVDITPKENLDKLEEVYGSLYEMVFVSGEASLNIDKLKDMISHGKVAFAGPSGVGKSTLINSLNPGANLETGEISSKTSRGKHTTRHVEIFHLDNGAMVYDTPGFTSFDVLEVDESELHFYYPEMEKHIGQCRFDNCRHIKEPSCAIIEALENGEIHRSRYDSYLEQINELRDIKMGIKK